MTGMIAISLAPVTQPPPSTQPHRNQHAHQRPMADDQVEDRNHGKAHQCATHRQHCQQQLHGQPLQHMVSFGRQNSQLQAILSTAIDDFG